jgi:hypothetical protein
MAKWQLDVKFALRRVSMDLALKKAALGVLALLALAGAARASEWNTSLRTADYGAHLQFIGDDDDDDDGDRFERRRYRYDERRYWQRHPDRYYGRPVPDYPYWGRPVFARPGWGQGECRIIVKRRMNEWGDVVIRRIKICD